MITDVINALNKFYFNLSKDPNSRDHSWEHCYLEFYKAKTQDIDDILVDYLCLHLAFYLASWGMYRGSSFLLLKDYKVHKEAVYKLLDKRYSPLWAISCIDLKSKYKNLLEDLVKELRSIYRDIRSSIKSNVSSCVSDILITKILIGTLGCVPAYDSYFSKGVKYTEVTTGTFSIKSLEQLIEFYLKYEQEFEKEKHKMEIGKIEYPEMKLLDMAFWQMGYTLTEDIRA
ncbi:MULTISPECIES: hypothetical protein [Faecalicatena]|uniref:hypothetical protein n=1 Tax=Faecalicatena TaxID=2005359 RepID=UPI001FE56584|nr:MULTISPECIES: hypothetical protein [Faecalicatena]MCI6468246.1 hypothetical protein [Faecalicatena sp.]MDY5620500.1 hypothetical protein [Lachnospiraceae bacterium]